VTRDERDSYRRVLARHMTALAEIHQVVLFLRLIEERDAAQTAQILQMSATEVSHIYREGLGALRGLMRKRRPRQ
jgi:DNA-directed RNA polymerase specialized sigma subunit